MTNIVALENVNGNRWSVMHLKADRVKSLYATAVRLCAPDARARYQGVTDALVKAGYQPVPWWFIAVISEREYGGPPHWDKQLGQGDPLGQASHNVPAGRGPFLPHAGDVTPGNDAWTRGCLDALIACAPYAAKWNTWTPGGTLTLFEEYNGLGYAARGIPSAYVWSGTDQYVSGKYIRDGVFDPNVVDVQEGCAAILVIMMAMDDTIQFLQEAAT